MTRVHIIGTSHVASKSITEVSEYIKKHSPTIVAVELDTQRYKAMKSSAKRSLPFSVVRQIGLFGYMFAVVGGFVQQRLAKKIGAKVGEDMMSAVRVAKECEAKVALIDLPVHITLRNLSKAFTFREFFRMIGDVFKGFFKRNELLEQIGDFDLHSVPPEKTIIAIVTYMKKHYPSLHKVLLDSRNKYMVDKIIQLCQLHPEGSILVVVGAAHRHGMLELLQKK
ncbi:MAG: pheromone shutdown protein TraB [Candidatus Woesearchaeota archaeon]|jgi:pheromone shutdown protein TraB